MIQGYIRNINTLFVQLVYEKLSVTESFQIGAESNRLGVKDVMNSDS